MGQIKIAEKPAILSIDDALSADSKFEDPVIFLKGNPEDVLAQFGTEQTVTGSFELGGQEHFYLEGQASLALPQENGDMVVQSSTQHPSEIQHKVAAAIGKPFHAVRVEIRRMGGGVWWQGKPRQRFGCSLRGRSTNNRPALQNAL